MGRIQRSEVRGVASLTRGERSLVHDTTDERRIVYKTYSMAKLTLWRDCGSVRLFIAMR